VLTSSVPLLVLAATLVVAAGGFAAADAALGTVSRARVEALVRSGRFGASALALVIADRPRHVNLLLLLRLSCELTATVLVTVAALRALTPIWLAVLVTGLAMVVVTYVVVGVGPRTIGRQHPYGVGLAVAILLDATLVRAVLLPAAMKLLGERNWYLPRQLNWLPRWEHEKAPEPVGA